MPTILIEAGKRCPVVLDGSPRPDNEQYRGKAKVIFNDAILRSTHRWNSPQTHAIIALLALVLVSPVSAQDVLLWSDEFSSGDVPDPDVWSYDLGASGWGNRELQEYTSRPENARIENGELIITVLSQNTGAPFTSARIRSQDKVTVKYGTIEARIRMPDLADGLWPAFWTLGNSFSEVGWPACGELDIMEMGNSSAIQAGLVNQRVGSAAHWEHNGGYATYGKYYDAPAPLNEGYQVHRMEWTPDFVRTYVDGALIWEMAIDPENCADCTEFHEPHFMILNVAVGGNYPNILAPSGITAPLPAEMMVDYVRVYDNGHTEMGGSAGTVPNVYPGHSGSWYNADQSGHGFSVEIGSLADDSPYAVIYWYTYDVMGNPIFLVGQGVPEGKQVEVDFISPVGMVYGVFDPDTVTRESGGTGLFDFSDEDNGTFSYTPSDFTTSNWGHTAIESLPIVKLFGIPVRGSGND